MGLLLNLSNWITYSQVIFSLLHLGVAISSDKPLFRKFEHYLIIINICKLGNYLPNGPYIRIFFVTPGELIRITLLIKDSYLPCLQWPTSNKFVVDVV